MPYPSNDPPEDLLGDDTPDSHRVARGELLAFIERVENVRGEIAELKQDEKEIFAEARGRGYDPKIIRKVLAHRRREPDDVAEEDALFQLYLDTINDI